MRLGLKLWSTNVDGDLSAAERLYGEGVYDYIELFVVPGSTGLIDAWRGLGVSTGVPFVIHNAHTAAGCNLADAAARERNGVLYREARDYADALGAKHVIFHGGIDGDLAETISQLNAFGEARALIENKPYLPLPNPFGYRRCNGSTPEEIARVRRETGCGFCLDFAHAIASANAHGEDGLSYLPGFFAVRPSMFHLSDTELESRYDRHLHVGAGTLPIGDILRTLPEDAMVSIEATRDPGTGLEDFRRDVQKLRAIAEGGS